MLDIQESIKEKYPQVENISPVVTTPIFGFLKKIIHQNDINEFLKEHLNDTPYDFIESVLEYFNFGYKVSSNQIENIPREGRVVIVANHPLGALDALSLIDMIRKVRTDIKVVANTLLTGIEQLKPLLIEVDAFAGKIPKKSVKKIYEALQKEEVVVIFPSGEVSRVSSSGIKDIKWNKGFLKFALKNQAPILPIYIKAKNSSLFYTISSLNKTLSASMLAHEMFKQKNKTLEFKIGELIPYESFSNYLLDISTQVKLFKKHLYRISKNKKVIFETQKCIAHPEDRQALKEELKSAKLLGKTTDNKKIYLYDFQKDSVILREVGRLREISFRKVGEGTGAKRDLDDYDYYYKHIILWDEENLEIVGSYRIAESNFIIKHYGLEGFYTNTLFKFQPHFEKYLYNSIELGRSFVQPKYWGSRALDYLWQGIGAYLKQNEHIKYMFGTVSLSSSLPKDAQSMIVYYYDIYYGRFSQYLKPVNPFKINISKKEEFRNIFDGEDIKGDFITLKEQLKCFDVTVPTLYKQYTDICEEEGISFMGFNIDNSFNNCIDSFILVEIDKIKDKKKQRYIK